MQIIDSVDAIADRYDAVLCDVWGVLHNGRQVYAPAVRALQRLRAAGKHVVLVTNVPKPRTVLPSQFERLGVPRDAWDVAVTSGDAIRAELAARAPGPMFKIGPEAYDRALWEGLGLQVSSLGEARFFAISGLNREDETPEDYLPLLQQARARDLDFLCANPDIVVQVGDQLIWCAGAVAREYARMGGRVVMAGKPWPPIYALAYRELEALNGKPVDKARVLAIGDGIPTDVAGANGQAIDCLFIASGMHGEGLWTDGAADAGKIRAAFAEEGVHAAYAMSALA